MIYLLGGRNNPAIRAIIGAVLLAAGIVVHGAAILAALGVVLLLWAGIQALKAHRTARQADVTNGGHLS
jgi:threonine/homoserine/homoserine lactone efflux protein